VIKDISDVENEGEAGWRRRKANETDPSCKGTEPGMEEDSAVATPSLVMMGFRSVPFRLFFPELPLVVLFKLAALAICFGFVVAFLMSAPFIVYWPEAAGRSR